MIGKLYLGDAFGWETERSAMVAIAQLRDEKRIHVDRCPKQQLVNNEPYRELSNDLKIYGYIPLINVVAGVAAIAFSTNDSSGCSPNHSAKWIVRGVAMIIGGPLLIVVDLIKFLYDRNIANKYCQENQQVIATFNTSHGHTKAYWRGHPTWCKIGPGVMGAPSSVMVWALPSNADRV